MLKFVITSNTCTCIFSRFIMLFLNEKDAALQFLFNVLLSVVMNCFWGITFNQLHSFSYNDVSQRWTLDFCIVLRIWRKVEVTVNHLDLSLLQVAYTGQPLQRFVPRKQFGYQESNCPCTHRVCKIGPKIIVRAELLSAITKHTLILRTVVCARG